MSTKTRQYVEKRNGGYYVVGSRVSLDSIVYEFLEGASPESIVRNFPSLSLEQVYGVITFYLANRPEMDTYLAETEKLWEEARKNQDPQSAELQKKLARAGQELLTKQT
jgi:uncharacterized protein (DUF433 family)